MHTTKAHVGGHGYSLMNQFEIQVVVIDKLKCTVKDYFSTGRKTLYFCNIL